MNFSAEKIPYDQTGSFSKIVLDFLSDTAALRPFYTYRPDFEGIKKAVADRRNFPVDRTLLTNILKKQYAQVEISRKLEANIDALLSDNTFTICTAHQPNIFTGHLYFIYKILHAVRLAEHLSAEMPGNKFVPIYYMGSEDADLEELGEVNIKGKNYRWNTSQKGAVGRMKIDKAFIEIIHGLEGQLSVEASSEAVLSAIKKAYREGRTIEAATFDFVHGLFNELGVIVLMPDERRLKRAFAPLVKRELTEQFSHAAVELTVADFPKEYKTQAAGRDINLFYLEGDSRERIEKTDTGFAVANTNLQFSKAALFEELSGAPEKFSPNVILRPLFQETILPNVAFIGGGGELAYWLELKKVFEEANVFFPVLILRNSFTFINKGTAATAAKLSLSAQDIFKPDSELIDDLVKTQSTLRLDLAEEIVSVKAAYDHVSATASTVDITLAQHSGALFRQALRRLEILEKKMLKSERKKFDAQQRQIRKIKSTLFPGGTLQERVDNILEYTATYGADFLKLLYEHSQALPESFTVIIEH